MKPTVPGTATERADLRGIGGLDIRAGEYIDESLHGCAKTGITVRDGLVADSVLNWPWPRLPGAHVAYTAKVLRARDARPCRRQKSTFLHCPPIMVTCAWVDHSKP